MMTNNDVEKVTPSTDKVTVDSQGPVYTEAIFMSDRR